MTRSVKENQKIEQLSQVIAVGLFAAQAKGLVKFPGSPGEGLTVGELQNRVSFVIHCVLAKADEVGLEDS